jgi:small subunit ribosomal protein S1
MSEPEKTPPPETPSAAPAPQFPPVPPIPPAAPPSQGWTSPTGHNPPAPVQPAPPPGAAPGVEAAMADKIRPAMAERVHARREAYKPGKPPALDQQDIRPEPPKLRELDALIEAELDAAMAGLDAKELYAEPAKDQRPTAQHGPKPMQKGKVLRVHPPDVFVEMPGGRSQGLLPMTQFPEGPPKVGDEVEFQIERYDPANGLMILTRQGAAVEADWSTVQVGQTVEARVTGTNKGGLSVEVNGIRAFLPISQIDLYRVENPEQYVNQRLLCMVTEVNAEERNLVVSRRALLERDRQEQAEKLWTELNEGQIRKGTVRSVKPFGAFVDLGGVDGLIPVGELSWKRVQDPTEVVQPGQQVEVIVARVDREKRKVSLSLRQLVASPYEQIAANYPPRTIVHGKVTRTAEFGAFVELEPGVEGLIHISELAPNRVFKVSNVVKEGQDVEVMVLNVDPEKRRIALSLKQALKAKEPPPPAPAAEEPAEEEPAAPAKPQRPRTTPLRGGTGGGGPLFPNLPSQRE